MQLIKVKKCCARAKTQNIQFVNGGGHPRGEWRASVGGSQAARISKQTIYTWRKRFGAFQANDICAPEVARGRECAAEEAGCRE
jgi:hypothetical protein